MLNVHNVDFGILNQTIPNESGRVHGWIFEPSSRGTASLLYNCLITIFLCVWSSLPTNIPKRNKSWMGNFLHKVKLAVFAIVAPEAVFLRAIDSCLFTQEALDELPAIFLEVRMIYLFSCNINCKQLTNGPLKGGLRYTKVHLWFISMGGFEIQCTDGNHRLSLDEIKYLIANKTISVSSIAITEDEILDRSKTDWVSKLITCIQILWFVIQLIGRAVQRLPITGLELYTLGIVVCSLGTYKAYWRRPQDIHLPITISVGEAKALCDVFGEPISLRTSFSWGEMSRSSEKIHLSLWLTTVITGIFGACHLSGWDFLYPSSVEQLLWRISSTLCAVTPFFLMPFTFILCKLYTHEASDSSFFEYCSGSMPFSMSFFFYFFARVYLLVASFVSLRSVSAGVYQTVDWSLYFLHL